MSRLSVHKKPVEPWATISGAAPFGKRQHRGPARHRLDHHQPEWLGPADRVDERLGAGQQPQFALAADLADVDRIVTEQRARRSRRSSGAQRVPTSSHASTIRRPAARATSIARCAPLSR